MTQKAKPKPKYVQVYEPKTKRWVKVSTLTCKIVGRKGTPGAFNNIPKRKAMPRRRKAATKPPQRRQPPPTGRKIKYSLPKKITSMVHGSAQGELTGGAAKTKRTRKKPDRKPDPIPQNIKDLGRANVKTQMVRVKCDKLQNLPVISTPDIAADILGGMVKHDREEVRVLYLNGANKVIGVETAHIGSVNASLCSPHEVYKTALLLNATGVMMAHNHPSGSSRPSDADITSANQFKQAGKTVNVKFLDSIIISDDGYYSLQQEGHL